MSSPRILINATAVRMGGALAHLPGLLHAMAHQRPDWSLLVLASPEVTPLLQGLPDAFKVRTVEASAWPAIRRLGWEQLSLPRQAQDFRAEAFVSFGSFSLLRPPCPQVLVAANALYVSDRYWRIVRAAGPGMRLAESVRAALWRASLRAADRVVVPTHAFAQMLAKQAQLRPEQLVVVHHGIHSSFLTTEGRMPLDARVAGLLRETAQVGGPTLLYVSKHGVNKDFDCVVRAVPELRRRLGGPVRVLLTGRPDESLYSRRTARVIDSLALSDSVFFLGEAPNDQVWALYREADLFVFASWCESFGLPLAEAMASGVPALAADIPTSRELAGDSVSFFQPGDSSQLAERAATLCTDRQAAAELGATAKARAAGFTWEEAARRTLELLASLVSTPQLVASARSGQGPSADSGHAVV